MQCDMVMNGLFFKEDTRLFAVAQENTNVLVRRPPDDGKSIGGVVNF